MNLNVNWELKVRNRIYKVLLKFPQKDQELIIKEIEKLPLNPYVGDIKKMKDEKNVWRQRIGSYRIFFEIISQEKKIYVFRLERRTSKTY